MYEASEIATKVKKLLALAARAGTEAEAVAAAAMAQEIIQRYNLTIGTEALEQESAVEQDGIGGSARLSPHLTILGEAACGLFDCDFYYNMEDVKDSLTWRATYRRSLRFVGLAKNVEACVLTFNYFVASVDSLLWGARQVNLEWSRSELRAYRLGCAARIRSMTSDLKKHRVELGGEQVQALVRIGQDVAKRHIASMKMVMHRVDSRIYASDDEAYSKGFDDGSRVDIHGAQSSRMLES